MGDELLPEFFNLIGFISIFFKKNFFKEEKEWRLVSIHGLDYKPDFRVTSRGVTPFVKIDAQPIDKKINKIIVGPKFDSDNINSVSQMIPNVKVEDSKGKLQ